MIIVEGADLVGKSTVVERLLEHPRVQAFGMVGAHLGPLPSGWDPFWSYVRCGAIDLVWDRYHMSELVYGSVIREDPRVTGERYELLDAELVARHCAYTVVITAEQQLLASRYVRAEMFTLSEIESVNFAFRECAQGKYAGTKTRCDAWAHCTTDRPFVTQDEINVIVANYWDWRLEYVKRKKASRDVVVPRAPRDPLVL